MNRSSRLFWISSFVLANFCWCTITMAQNTTPPKKDDKKDEVEIPDPETLTLTTKDNVLLKATFYGGTEGKETVPVILVHDWSGNRTDVDEMALRLQKDYGCAVIIPDMRGHGESRTTRTGDEVDLERYKKLDYLLFNNDIEACKIELMKKNNVGELNIEMLTVMAIGEMNVIAVQWCIADWNFPPVGGYKQGQDVKLLLMVSPRKKLKGISMVPSLKANLLTGKGLPPLGIYIMYGKNSDAGRDSNSIAQNLLKSRQKLDEKRLGAKALNSSLTGTKLVANSEFQEMVGDFLQEKFFAEKADFPWQNRERD